MAYPETIETTGADVPVRWLYGHLGSVPYLYDPLEGHYLTGQVSGDALIGGLPVHTGHRHLVYVPKGTAAQTYAKVYAIGLDECQLVGR
jgi:hypothetical protein